MFTDTDESRFRIPEHEAAKSLLFLSLNPRSRTASPNFLVPCRPMTYPYGGKIDLTSHQPLSLNPTHSTIETTPDHLADRRSSSITSPATNFVSIKQDQYYPNPKVPISPQNDSASHAIDEYSMPMDLTKKRDHYPNIRQPTLMSSELLPLDQPRAAGIPTLVTIADSHLHNHSTPQPTPDNTRLQCYLTELALQDSKMKQSQIYRTQLPSTSFVTTMTSAKGPTSSSAMQPILTHSNGLLLSAMPCAVSSYQIPSGHMTNKVCDVNTTKRTNHILREPNRKNILPNDFLVVQASTGHAENASALHPFDALKNSPNPSKVTYTKVPDGLTWSIKPIVEPVANVVLAPMVEPPTQTVVYSLIDEQPKVTITVNEAGHNESQHLVSSEHSTIGMDTLAEIAASSVKLDTTPIQISTDKYPYASSSNSQPSVVGSGSMPLVVAPAKPGFGAKSVASEYLKRTSAEYMKAHFTKSDREDTDMESDSEGEANPPAPAEPIVATARTVVVGEDGFKTAPPTTTADVATVHRGFIQEDGRSACKICSKTFPKKHQMQLHMNIHYMERKHRCEPCGVGFRTHSTLQKHERGEAHKNKALMTSTFGVPTTTNPRPFECSDCNIAFRIHGHLAKHLRSKTHVQKLECLQKLPFGTYAAIEGVNFNLTEIDTTDCENSLADLRQLAQRLLEKDPSKLAAWQDGSNGGAISGEGARGESSNSDDGGEPIVSADDENDVDVGGGEKIVKRKCENERVAGEEATVEKRRKLSGADIA